MQGITSAQGKQDMNTLYKLIREIYIPMEKDRPNMQTMLMNYAKSIKESINQISGSRAINIPEYLEEDEDKALADPDTIREYQRLIVISDLNFRKNGPPKSRISGKVKRTRKRSSEKLTRSSIIGDLELLFSQLCIKT